MSRLNRFWGLALIGLLSGCAFFNGYYQPATVIDGVIHNSQVGWNGYTVKVPSGVRLFNPVAANLDGTVLTDLQQRFIKQDNSYVRNGFIAYSERFLLENMDGTDSYVGFMSDTLQLGAPWGLWLPIEKQEWLGRVIHDKRLSINDLKAHAGTLTINGQLGCYISGTGQTSIRKGKNQSYAYEGYLILGNLKEVFWIEGFGSPETRAFLKEKTRAMVNSLDVL